MKFVSKNLRYFERSFHRKKGDIFAVREKEDTWHVLMDFDLFPSPYYSNFFSM